MKERQMMWSNGYAPKCAIEDAVEVIEQIRERDGSVSAEAVVESAKPKDSPIHTTIIDKGLKAAAEEHYKANARKMMRSMVEHIKRPSGQVIKSPVYTAINVPGPKTQGRQKKVYGSTEELLRDPCTRDEVLGNAIRDALSYRRKYAALQELSKVFQALDDFVENFGS